LSNALKEYLPESVRFIEPDGGFFIWLVFPENVDTGQLLGEARKKKVGYLPGVKFSSAKLSFSYFDVPELEEGARRLAEVFKSHL
jgi:2-aminoadipate transaminase